MIDKITTEMLVGLGLVFCLGAAIFLGMNELAMSIASGLIGYIGHGQIAKKEGEHDGK